ncbi:MULTISPECIES: zinc ribbon domain-containing protein [Haloarcula]|uniref:zinc ribbon domain-containing protein n=1 Tax=Haloarcula TaxID=2237 RepID=UPI0023EAD768|nr:zinc ribbon domain-containing protein [Halomicroarcula sp. XH51]
MAALVQVLGTLAVLVTLSGSYRLFSFFFDDPLFSGLVAAAVTVAFMIAFPVVTTALGLAVLVAPFVVAYRYRDRLPSTPALPALPALPDLSGLFDGGLSSSTGETGGQRCPNCGAKNDQLNRHCDDCGALLVGGDA